MVLATKKGIKEEVNISLIDDEGNPNIRGYIVQYRKGLKDLARLEKDMCNLSRNCDSCPLYGICITERIQNAYPY